MEKKIFWIGAVFLILFVNMLSPILTAQNKEVMIQKEMFYKKQSLEKTNEINYYVVFRPFGAINSDDYTVIKKMNETLFISFKKDCDSLRNKHLSSVQLIDQQLKIYIKYGIMPQCFTLKNLTEAVKELNVIFSNQSIGKLNGDPVLGRLTFGPHMIIYCSLLSAVMNFQPGQTPLVNYSIDKIVDILNISKNSSLYKMLYNITVFRYLGFALLNVLVGGSLGFYLSIGLLPGIASYSIILNPFVGVYIFCFGGGIYIYKGHDEWDKGYDKAMLDFFILFTPFSMVTYREFSQPTP